MKKLLLLTLLFWQISTFAQTKAELYFFISELTNSTQLDLFKSMKEDVVKIEHDLSEYKTNGQTIIVCYDSEHKPQSVSITPFKKYEMLRTFITGYDTFIPARGNVMFKAEYKGNKLILKRL